MLIMPITIKSGLGSLGHAAEDRSAEVYRIYNGTYRSEHTWLRLENGSGWFFDGTYFLPLSFNWQDLSYRSAGLLPHSVSQPESSVIGLTAEGIISKTRRTLTLYDPFTQSFAEFELAEETFNTSYIDLLTSADYVPAGTWKLLSRPDLDFDAPFVREVHLNHDQATLNMGDLATGNTVSISGDVNYHDGLAEITLRHPLDYDIVTPYLSRHFHYDDMIPAIVYATEKGLYLGLNLFGWHIFRNQ